jgi:hypothetical protein
VDPSRGRVDLESFEACAYGGGGHGYPWDRWTAIRVGTSGGAGIWEFENVYNHECLYDNQQADAIYAACSSSNHFEWFKWPGSDL